MNQITYHKALDPSHTIMLRNAFNAAIQSRFTKFKKTLTEVILKDDVFGLSVNYRPGHKAFAFPRSTDKIAAFTQWMGYQISADILQVGQPLQVGSSVNNAWTSLFVQNAYKQGVIKARTQLKKIAPSISRTGGIEAVLTQPKHVDRLGYLFLRVFDELKGITQDMDLQITKVIAQGISDNVSSERMIRQINEVIVGVQSSEIINSASRKTPSKVRAELLARTEVIRAFADAQLQEFENWKVHGVSAKAEISTAKDHRVCPKCAHLEGNIYTIEEARGLIPVHPLCRCIWLPFIE